VTEPGAVFISIGKLKTHVECMATLSLKNLFGVPPIGPYLDPARENFRPRFGLHDRSVGQAVADIARARPIDYAIVDGVWGLEGNGPVDLLGGIPVQANVVVAGRNPLAVDLVCLDVMGIARESVQHLEYAYLQGLGPFDLSQIEVVGDPVSVRPFLQPVIPPKVWPPKIAPLQFSPPRGEKASVLCRVVEDAQVQVQVLRTSDQKPSQTLVRTLQPWADLPAGSFMLQWDGRDDAGLIAPPTLYGVRVQARRLSSDNFVASGINWVVTTA
jgi:hypothetical protein